MSETTKTTPDVFISYKAEEFEEACFIKDVLETNGITSWMAPNSIPGGSSYASEIPKAIRGCKVFVVLLSEKAQQSQWVPRELDQAVNAKKTIMPFMLEDCILKDDFNFYLSNVQRYAAYENKSKALERMTREIKAVIAAQAPAQEEAEQTQPQTPQPVQSESETPEKQPVKKAPKAPKKKKEKKVKPAQAKKSKKPLFIALGCVAALVIAIVLGIVLSKTTIMGEKLKKSTYSASFEGKTVTAEDAEKLLALKNISLLRFTNCKMDAQVCKALFESEKLSTLAIVNCNLDDTMLADVSAENSRFSNLDLEGNHIKNIDFIKSYSATLQQLSLKNNQVSSLKALEACELTNINVENNALKDLNGLEKSVRLQTIYAKANQISDLSGIKNCTVIEQADFNDNEIFDISVLEKSAKTLTTLLLAHNSLFYIDALKDTTQLKYVAIDGTGLSDISPLKNNSELQMLSAAQNTIQEFTLPGCTKLTYLNMADNALSGTLDLSKVESENLRVNVANNELSEVKLPEQAQCALNVYGNLNMDPSFYRHPAFHSIIADYNSGTDYAAVYHEGMGNVFLCGVPLDRQVAISDAFKKRVEFVGEEDVKIMAGENIPEQLNLSAAEQ